MRIFVYGILVCVFLLASACGKDEDTIVSEQAKIASYLDKIDLEEGSYDYLGGVFRHVGNAGRDGYATAVEAATGDEVTFYFSAHLLNPSAEVSAQPLIYTNKQRLIDGLRPGLTGHWSAEPHEAKLGSSPLAKGIQRGLIGAREKDSLLLFMSSDMGYGNREMFNIPKNSSLLFIIELVSVKKQ